jgi:hypothetical protein
VRALLVLTVVLGSLGTAAAAKAQDGVVLLDEAREHDFEDAPRAEAADQGAATTYDFEDDLVTGDLVRPDGELLSARRRGRRVSLIRIREHFIPELLKSVENL